MKGEVRRQGSFVHSIDGRIRIRDFPAFTVTMTCQGCGVSYPRSVCHTSCHTSDSSVVATKHDAEELHE